MTGVHALRDTIRHTMYIQGCSACPPFLNTIKDTGAYNGQLGNAVAKPARAHCRSCTRRSLIFTRDSSLMTRSVMILVFGCFYFRSHSVFRVAEARRGRLSQEEHRFVSC